MADLYTEDNVRVWASNGGAVFWAPKGTSLPEAFDEALDAGFIPVGILSEDGVSEGLSVESNKIKGWPGGRTVRVVATSTEKTFSFTALENTPLIAKLYYGASDPVAAGTGARVDLPEAVGVVEGAWVIEKHDGGTVERRCIELGQVTDRGDRTANSSDADGRELTVESVGEDYILTNADAFVDALDAGSSSSSSS